MWAIGIRELLLITNGKRLSDDRGKCDLVGASVTLVILGNFDRPTGQPTDQQPKNTYRQTLRFTGLLHFQKCDVEKKMVDDEIPKYAATPTIKCL